MAAIGSIVLTNAVSGTVNIAGADDDRGWTVKSFYNVKYPNPNLKIWLLIGTSRFLIAPGVTPSTHTANGKTVSYEFVFINAAEVTVTWEVT